MANIMVDLKYTNFGGTYHSTGSLDSFSPTSYLDVKVPGQKFGKYFAYSGN
jgi:hypothetical protein